jgi:hypothetical protein
MVGGSNPSGRHLRERHFLSVNLTARYRLRRSGWPLGSRSSQEDASTALEKLGENERALGIATGWLRTKMA